MLNLSFASFHLSWFFKVFLKWWMQKCTYCDVYCMENSCKHAKCGRYHLIFLDIVNPFPMFKTFLTNKQLLSSATPSKGLK